MMAANLALIVGGCGALYFGAEWLVRGAASIAASLGVSPLVVGLTLVSLGTSAPELVVGAFAALEGETGLLFGNVMGSNLANIGLILGTVAVIRPLAVADRVVTRDLPIMLLISLCTLPLLVDRRVDRMEGVILMALLVVYVAFTFYAAEGEEDSPDVADPVAPDPEGDAARVRALMANLGWVALGALGLGFGGKAIVEGASYLASALGVSAEVIGLTVVAVGTSLPELVTSVVAAARQQADIAVGNIVGSNVFNLTAVLGVATLVREFPVDPTVLSLQLPAVLAISLLLWPIAWSRRRVSRAEGVLLLAVYCSCAAWIALVG